MRRAGVRWRAGWVLRWGGPAVCVLVAMAYAASTARVRWVTYSGPHRYVGLGFFRGALTVSAVEYLARTNQVSTWSYRSHSVRGWPTRSWRACLGWRFKWWRTRQEFSASVPLWAVLAAGCAASLPAWAVRSRRRAKGACRRCGYDLAGLGAGAVCPECGAA